MTLTEFLLARIAEDEAVARAAADHQGAHWFDEGGIVSSDAKPVDPRGDHLDMYAPDDRWMLWDCEGASSLGVHETTSAHIARHDPARVLAECEAKLRIVEAFSSPFDQVAEIAEGLGERWEHLTDDHRTLTRSDYVRNQATLCALASVYADHPDFDQAWTSPDAE